MLKFGSSSREYRIRAPAVPCEAPNKRPPREADPPRRVARLSVSDAKVRVVPRKHEGGGSARAT